MALALAVIALVLPATASAYSAAPGYRAGDYAAGFPFESCCGWGPVGVAFDGSDNLYVSDNADGHIYRFQPGGGQVSSDTRLTSRPLSGDIKGLAITRDGGIYLARAAAGDVVEISAATGTVRRRVVSGISCPTALAVDPVSGDLFASQSTCGTAIMRIHDFRGGPGRASAYSSDLCCVDGLAFAPDGTLYAVNAGQILQISGTSSQDPGSARTLTHVRNADGLAIGTGPRREPLLVVNRTDGNITRLDLSTSPPARSTVLSGGSRGDFVAVDSRGCLYATQSTSIVRIAPETGGCDLSPSTPGTPPPPGLIVDVLGAVHSAAPAGRCRRLRRVVVRVRQRGRVRLRWVKVYVNGKRRRTLGRRRVTSRIVLRSLPHRSFTVKLVARTTQGRTLEKKRRFRNC